MRSKLLCALAGAAAVGIASPAAAQPLGKLAVYPSNANFGAPGMYLPDGPDAVVTASLVCPAARAPGVYIAIPSGASTARYVVPETAGPLYQPIAESLTQDYAHSPHSVLFRLHYGPVAIDGYLGFQHPADVMFRGPGCAHPWHLHVVARRLKDTYTPGTLPSYGVSLVPFPDEPKAGSGF